MGDSATATLAHRMQNHKLVQRYPNRRHDLRQRHVRSILVIRDTFVSASLSDLSNGTVIIIVVIIITSIIIIIIGIDSDFSFMNIGFQGHSGGAMFVPVL